MRLAALLVAGLAGITPGHGEFALVERWPTGGNVCVDAPLRLIFNQPPTLGVGGKIEVCRVSDGQTVEAIEIGATQFIDRVVGADGFLLHIAPAFIDGNTASISLRGGSLRYGESYLVRIGAGVFKDTQGHPFLGLAGEWKFRTKEVSPLNRDRVTVATDGSADFCTVQGAVDMVEPRRERPRIIYIRKGHYQELVRVGRKQSYVHLLGEDRKGTVIACTNNENLNSGLGQRSVLGVEGDGFVLENLTVQNMTPYRGSQAEAVYIKADRCVLRNADFLSFQDTLHLSGRVYVFGCHVAGDVDFVWGYGSACLERCELHSLHDGCIVQARNSTENCGYIFRDCALTAEAGVKKCWLARIDASQFPASHVAFIHCAMGGHILPAGWEVTGSTSKTLRFEEFGSTGLDGKNLDVSNRSPCAKQLTAPQAAAVTCASVLSGSDHWKPGSKPLP